MRIRIGAVLLVLGTVQFFVAHVVVASAWPTPYSWSENYISDLGAVTCGTVCSPLHAVMNSAFLLQGVLLIGGTLLTAAAWTPSTGRRVWQGLVVASGVSWVVVGLAPEDVARTAHATGALPGFVVSNVALLVAGFSTSTRVHRSCQRAAAVLGVVGVAGFVLLAIASGRPDGVVGIGAAERLVVFPLQIWALVVGIALLVADRGEPRAFPPRPQAALRRAQP